MKSEDRARAWLGSLPCGMFDGSVFAGSVHIIDVAAEFEAVRREALEEAASHCRHRSYLQMERLKAEGNREAGARAAEAM